MSEHRARWRTDSAFIVRLTTRPAFLPGDGVRNIVPNVHTGVAPGTKGTVTSASLNVAGSYTISRHGYKTDMPMSPHFWVYTVAYPDRPNCYWSRDQLTIPHFGLGLRVEVIQTPHDYSVPVGTTGTVVAYNRQSRWWIQFDEAIDSVGGDHYIAHTHLWYRDSAIRFLDEPTPPCLLDPWEREQYVSDMALHWLLGSWQVMGGQNPISTSETLPDAG